jgi:hypothetical protein
MRWRGKRGRQWRSGRLVTYGETCRQALCRGKCSSKHAFSLIFRKINLAVVAVFGIPYALVNYRFYCNYCAWCGL